MNGERVGGSSGCTGSAGEGLGAKSYEKKCHRVAFLVVFVAIIVLALLLWGLESLLSWITKLILG